MKTIWREEDILKPDRETVDKAFTRLFGKPFDRENWLAKMDDGDHLKYIMEEAIVCEGGPGNSAILIRPALLTSENTALCRRLAIWTSKGYRVPIHAGGAIIEYLGAVKPRHDTRWNWWRWKSKYHPWRTGQGVAASETEAKNKVLEGWNES